MKTNSKRKSCNEVAKEDATLVVLRMIKAEKIQADIAKELDWKPYKVSRLFAELEKEGKIYLENRTSCNIWKVAEKTGMTQHSDDDGVSLNFHNVRGYYKIITRGLMPTESSKVKPMNNKGNSLSFDFYTIQANTRQIQLIFKKKYIAYIRNKFEGKRALNALTNVADDMMRQFCTRYGWEVDYATREVIGETKVLTDIKGVKGIKGKNFKLVYGDGEVEGEGEQIIGLLEGYKAMQILPEKLEVMEKCLLQLQDISLRTVEALEGITAKLSGQVVPSDVPMKPKEEKDENSSLNFIG